MEAGRAIRLIAFDLDGTAILRHRVLSPGNRAALVAAGERGMILVPATGRMRTFLPEEVAALPGAWYAITSNGAAVDDLALGRPVFQRLIPNGKARRVQRLLDEYDLYVEYYRDGGAITKTGNPERAHGDLAFPMEKLHFVDGKSYQFVPDLAAALRETGLCPEKINLPYLRKETRAELWERLEALGGLRLTSSLPDNIEINDAGAHKGAALEALAQRLGIPLSQVMAIGDNGNDVTMLRAASCSVAVGDGSAEAKAAARYLTAPHDQDGLAQAIARWALP